MKEGNVYIFIPTGGLRTITDVRGDRVYFVFTEASWMKFEYSCSIQDFKKYFRPAV